MDSHLLSTNHSKRFTALLTHSYIDGRGCHARLMWAIQCFLSKVPYDISMLSHSHTFAHRWNSCQEQFVVKYLTQGYLDVQLGVKPTTVRLVADPLYPTSVLQPSQTDVKWRILSLVSYSYVIIYYNTIFRNGKQVGAKLVPLLPYWFDVFPANNCSKYTQIGGKTLNYYLE